MIDSRKVRMMTKIAVYEQGDGREDLKLFGYSRRTYLNMKRMVSFFTLTIAYLLGAGLYCFRYIDEIFLKGFGYDYKDLLIRLLIAYVLMLAVGMILLGRIYRRQYDRAIEGLKEYDRDLYNLKKHLDDEASL
ncbi:MAG: hypothetical protein IJ137_02525 [Eubacterium sp.]|nr:hypothetical protein [Eubacterium sp.]